MSAWALALAGGWVAAYLGFASSAVVAAGRARRKPLPSAHARRILVVRPCTGQPTFLAATLASTSRLRHPGELVVRFTVADARDPAWPLVRDAAARLREDGIDARALVAATRAPNAKAGQLARATADAAAFDIVAVIDADVALEGPELVGLSTCLNADVGAAWTPVQERQPPRTVGDRASSAILGRSLHAFDLLGRLDRGGLVGKCFAVRTDALLAVGGFAAVAHHLGEDMELSRRLADAGFRTAVTARPAGSVAGDRSLRDVVARYRRWLLVMRAQRPWRLLAYPLLICAALPLALIGVGLALGGVTAGLAVAALALLVRVAVVAATEGATARRGLAAVVDAFVADAVLAWAWGSALGARQTQWGGRQLRLGRDGRLLT